jgi:general secretion pathway protein C
MHVVSLLHIDLRKIADQFLQETWLRRAASVVNLLLLLLLAYSLAELSWKLLPRPAENAAPLPGSIAVNAPATGARTPVWDLARRHLFGAKPAADLGVDIPSAPLPETKLNLQLRGVVAGTDGGPTGAIIAEPSGSEDFYALDSAVPGGAILKEVQSDHVVLSRNNRLEILKLPVDLLSPDSAAGVSTQRGATPAPSVIPGADLSLRQYRDLLINDPRSLMAADIVRIVPYNRDGRFAGYEIRPGRDASTFARFGLNAGDVVTAVNGIPLDTPAAGLGILRDISDASEVRLDIQRGGVPQTIVLNLD